MQEIEVKILEIDPEKVAKRLVQEFGFVEKGSGEFRASYFDNEAGSISAEGCLLRLRKEGPLAVLAFKRPLSRDGVKIMEEHQTGVADFDAMEQVLRSLGYKPFSETRKHRRIFHHDAVEIVIDAYQDGLGHIPPFLEIEAPSEAALYAWMDRLGIERTQANTWDTYGLIRHYGQIREVSVSETQYVRSVVLRPNWKPEDCIVPDDADPEAFHLAFDFGEKPVGVASLYPKPLEGQGPGGWRLRQMGVLADQQGKGIGRKLMLRTFDILRERNVPYLWCDAREVAYAFYESLGFRYVSDVFDVPQVGPHRKMVKELG